jgi:hypothetical protein
MYIYKDSQVKKKIKLLKRIKSSISKRLFLKMLNNPKNEIYKSFSKMLDKNYGKLSNEEMADELTKYFDELKNTDPKLFKDWINLFKYNKFFTLDIGKNDERYIFGINNVDTHGIENTKISVAETANMYNSRCAEVVLKTLVNHKLDERHFYDIKFKKRIDNIVCYPHSPCSTCSADTSLWSWKYPH